MHPLPRLRALAALALVLPLGLGCAQAAPPAAGPSPEPARAARPAAYQVLAISVDGLNTRAITKLGPRRVPHLYRLIRHGAHTLNARSEYEQNVTLPNHTSMLTGRRIDAAKGGHGVTWDGDRPRMTVRRAAGHPVASIFTAVHAAGRSTALFSTKSKFSLYERSWPRSISRFHVDEHQQALVGAAVRDLVHHHRAFTFLHVSWPDKAGHEYGGMSPAYLRAVRRTDAQLGRMLRAIHRHQRLERHLVVILTADHGFAAGARTHAPRILANYRIPFLVWGRGVAHADLYRLNPDYRNPGTARPGYAAARQPVRNGDVADLALGLLGLHSVPGSELDRRQDLSLR